MSEDKFKRFKKLLEYFIAHLEYIQNESIDNKGYSIYIAPLIHNMTFQTCGQGYSGAKIQNQISEWQDYGDSTICINVQGHYGKGYYTKKCYLNWKETGINIYAKWNDAKTRITHLAFTDYMYWLDPPEYKDSEKFSIEDLGLFDDSEPNTEIAKMFNKFYLKIYNYKMNGMTKRYQDLLLANKNMILNGAPGTGKTYLSKLIASQMIKSSIKSDTTMEENQFINDHIGFVQFHPSLDYTDFVEGLRPYEEIGNIGFKRRDGIFKKFCKKAISHSNENFVFIIDEINRGNLSKIFGELFMLIEKDKRGIELQLLYSDENFSVPANVYIIGMMNTADRSLAMLDYALRRRFSFFTMKPGFNTPGFQAYQDSLKSDAFNKLIACVKQLNSKIAEDISLGEGFCIGHSYFCGLTPETANAQTLSSIIEYELIPLLKEYWFDEPAKVIDWSDRLRSAVK